jgi:hypothetical protein
MEISTALTLSLGKLRQPVVTTYQISVILFQLYQAKAYEGQALPGIEKEVPTPLDLKRVTNQLLTNGVIQPHKNFGSFVNTFAK